MSTQAPTIDTHVPIKVTDLPNEPAELAVGRPDLPTPSLWQNSVQVTHKATGRKAIVVRVDWGTNMFRAFYPEQQRFSERTEWEHCRDWDVDVTYSPRELERQAARNKLEAEIAKLDPSSFAAVQVLCDDDDPAKALAKLEALRQLGVVKASPEAAQAVITEGKAKK
jgi:hypothetical protein